mgnify:FL=1
MVSAGDGRGRCIGFPTANLRVTTPEHVPRGVFAGWASWDLRQKCTAVINIGQRPTFADDGGITVEVHVLDFEGDLYGKTVVVQLGQKLRDEQRFDSAHELTLQIAKDIQRTRIINGTGA